MALGALGVIVPGLPTTVFVLTALWAFARSSPAAAERVRANRWLGPYIRDWDAERAVPRRAKVVASLMMALSCALLSTTQAPQAVVVGVTLTLVAVSAWMWTRPEPRGSRPLGELG